MSLTPRQKMAGFFMAGVLTAGLTALASSMRRAPRLSFRPGIIPWDEVAPADHADAGAENAGSCVTEDVYRLTFPNGDPVRVGELQLWLDEIRTDPEVSHEEFVVAADIVQRIRAKLN